MKYQCCIIICFLCCIFLFNCNAYAAESNKEYNYNNVYSDDSYYGVIEEKGIILQTFPVENGEAYIPAEVEGYPVIDIDPAMYLYDCNYVRVSPDNNYLTEIEGIIFSKDLSIIQYYPPGREEKKYSIPDGIKTIGRHAFMGSCLEQIDIPDTVVEIGDYAFSNNDALQNVYISEFVQKIGCSPFLSSDVVHINISNDNRFYYIKDESLIEKETKTLIEYCPVKKEAYYVIPEEVRIIGSRSFEWNLDLESIIVPEGLREIREEAFSYCRRLVYINLPDTLNKLASCIIQSVDDR